MPLNAQSSKGRIKQLIVDHIEGLPPSAYLQCAYYPGLCTPEWQAQSTKRTQEFRIYQREAQAATDRGDIPPDPPTQTDGTIEDLLPVLHSWDYSLSPEDEAAQIYAPITKEVMQDMAYDILLAIAAAIIDDMSPDPMERRQRRSARRSGFGSQSVRARVLPPIEHETQPRDGYGAAPTTGPMRTETPTSQPQQNGPQPIPDPVTTVGASMAAPTRTPS